MKVETEPLSQGLRSDDYIYMKTVLLCFITGVIYNRLCGKVGEECLL